MHAEGLKRSARENSQHTHEMKFQIEKLEKQQIDLNKYRVKITELQEKQVLIHNELSELRAKHSNNEENLKELQKYKMKIKLLEKDAKESLKWRELAKTNENKKPPLNLFKGGFASLVGMAGRQLFSVII